MIFRILCVTLPEQTALNNLKYKSNEIVQSNERDSAPRHQNRKVRVKDLQHDRGCNGVSGRPSQKSQSETVLRSYQRQEAVQMW